MNPTPMGSLTVKAIVIACQGHLVPANPMREVNND